MLAVMGVPAPALGLAAILGRHGDGDGDGTLFPVGEVRAVGSTGVAVIRCCWCGHEKTWTPAQQNGYPDAAAGVR
jgi:hypothetical protein